MGQEKEGYGKWLLDKAGTRCGTSNRSAEYAVERMERGRGGGEERGKRKGGTGEARWRRWGGDALQVVEGRRRLKAGKAGARQSQPKAEDTLAGGRQEDVGGVQIQRIRCLVFTSSG